MSDLDMLRHDEMNPGNDGVAISLTRDWWSWVRRKIRVKVIMQIFLVAGGSRFCGSLISSMRRAICDFSCYGHWNKHKTRYNK